MIYLIGHSKELGSKRNLGCRTPETEATARNLSIRQDYSKLSLNFQYISFKNNEQEDLCSPLILFLFIHWYQSSPVGIDLKHLPIQSEQIRKSTPFIADNKSCFILTPTPPFPSSNPWHSEQPCANLSFLHPSVHLQISAPWHQFPSAFFGEGAA